MSNVCNVCGLPEELCVCDDVEATESTVKLSLDSRSYDKSVTIVEGIDSGLDDLASELKSMLACGGTVKDGHIELQGDHIDRVRTELEDRGYTVE